MGGPSTKKKNRGRWGEKKNNAMKQRQTQGEKKENPERK